MSSLGAVLSTTSSRTAARPRRQVYSVSAVVRRADEVIRERARPLWIRGEVSGWSRSKLGHCYFTLKDDRAELCCTLWANVARSLPALPEDGMEVEVYGQLGIYQRRGQFQLDVGRIESTGVGGLWQVARERLIAELRRDGLLDEARKRPLPGHPERVGVVTSTKGAVIHDMHRALRRKAWWVSMLVSDCAVEGADAAPGIAAAIRRFGSTVEACPVDILIVARGGGSMESLWGYNLEPVARAIADCPVPVISAVGHETDYTVADLVADARAATPTAGAEMAVPDGREIARQVSRFPGEARLRLERSARLREERLLSRREAIDGVVARRLDLMDAHLDALGRHLEAQSPRRVVERLSESLSRAEEDLHTSMQRRIIGVEREAERRAEQIEKGMADRVDALERSLAAGAEALEGRNPLRVLSRGYAVVSDGESGRPVRSVRSVRAEQRLRVRLSDGTLDVRAEASHPDDETDRSGCP